MKRTGSFKGFISKLKSKDYGVPEGLVVDGGGGGGGDAALEDFESKIDRMWDDDERRAGMGGDGDAAVAAAAAAAAGAPASSAASPGGSATSESDTGDWNPPQFSLALRNSLRDSLGSSPPASHNPLAAGPATWAGPGAGGFSLSLRDSLRDSLGDDEEHVGEHQATAAAAVAVGMAEQWGSWEQAAGGHMAHMGGGNRGNNRGLKQRSGTSRTMGLAMPPGEHGLQLLPIELRAANSSLHGLSSDMMALITSGCGPSGFGIPEADDPALLSPGGTASTAGGSGDVPPSKQCGLYSPKMALVTSDCDEMCSIRTKRPESPRIVPYNMDRWGRGRRESPAGA